MTIPASRRGRTDYGLDAPGLVRGFLLGGTAAVVASVVLPHVLPPAWLGNARWALGTFRWGGGAYVLTGLMMVLSSRVGKPRARDRLLDLLTFAPDARVLDVGCGRGLLLVGAARRLPQGRAVGIDLWSQADQSANSRAATLANAAAEGVADRVEVHDGDMTMLPFDDDTFDVVVSSLAIHNVADRRGRREAMREIVRVLRPGGQIAIVDIAYVADDAADLRDAGLSRVDVLGFARWIFPPARMLVARK